MSENEQEQQQSGGVPNVSPDAKSGLGEPLNETGQSEAQPNPETGEYDESGDDSDQGSEEDEEEQ